RPGAQPSSRPRHHPASRFAARPRSPRHHPPTRSGLPPRSDGRRSAPTRSCVHPKSRPPAHRLLSIAVQPPIHHRDLQPPGPAPPLGHPRERALSKSGLPPPRRFGSTAQISLPDVPARLMRRRQRFGLEPASGSSWPSPSSVGAFWPPAGCPPRHPANPYRTKSQPSSILPEALKDPARHRSPPPPPPRQ
ncbi:MAG: hypothetical protein QOF20_2032, partial [Acidimicrobiaceae bacterium]|nr:hypothetical protein [Acidimicrobiaceae bacterium]